MRCSFGPVLTECVETSIWGLPAAPYLPVLLNCCLRRTLADICCICSFRCRCWQRPADSRIGQGVLVSGDICAMVSSPVSTCHRIPDISRIVFMPTGSPPGRFWVVFKFHMLALLSSALMVKLVQQPKTSPCRVMAGSHPTPSPWPIDYLTQRLFLPKMKHVCWQTLMCTSFSKKMPIWGKISVLLFMLTAAI